MKNLRVIIFIFSLLFSLPAFSQEEEDAKKIDSIKTALSKANHDTTRIKLYLALAENIYDPEVWPTYNQKSITIAEKLITSGDTSIKKVATQALANGLNNKGYYFSSIGRYDSAMYFYLRSTELMLKTKDKEGSAIVLMNIGLLLNNKGDYVGSIDYYYKSLRIFESIKNDIGISQVYNNLASVFNYLKDEEKAKEYFYKSIEIKKKLKNPVLLSNGYNNIGSYFDKLHMYDSSRIYYHKALIIKRKFRDIHGIMNLYNNLGASYMDQKKYDSAHIYLDKSFEMAQKNNFMEGLAYSYSNLADLYLKEDNIAQSEKLALKALELSQHYKLLKVTLMSYRTLTFTYKKKRDFEKAMLYSNNYHRLNDSLFNSDKQRSIAVLQIKHDYEKEMFADSLKRAQLEKENEMKHLAEVQKQKAFSYIGLTVTVFLLIMILLLFNRYKIKQRTNRILEEKNHIILNQKEKVQIQKELIERKSNEVLDSINYVQRIQQSLLSSNYLFKKHFSQHFILFKPKDIVSGDFYWATETDDGLIVVTGDCTGHGVPGAFMSVLMISKLSEVVREKKITRPDLILNQLRTDVIQSLNATIENGVTRDGMDAVVYKFHPKTKRLEFAAANNSFYILKNNDLIIAKPDKMPVGVSDNDSTSFTYNEMELSEGDIVYTFTDGYADQFGGPKGKKYKYKQLQELLQKISGYSLDEQKSILVKEFENWKGTLEQVDDVCLIGIKV